MTPRQSKTPTDRLPAKPRRGFTLVELLVAAAIALVVMGALASLLGVFSRTGTNSQSIVDMSSRMRSTAIRLRQDLGGITAPLAPPLSPEAGLGYFEIVEGPMEDGLATTASGSMVLQSGTVWASGTSSILADTDDALIFTTRSLSGPFEGRYGNTQIESNTAEVAWFCRPSATQPFPNSVQLQTLYRRQLLVVGYVGASPFFAAVSPTNNQVAGTLPAAYGTYDISLRADPTVANALVPNTLADLTQRENRFFHGPLRDAAFPNSLTGLTFDGSPREGDDVILTNVISFDVRVFDPAARPMLNGTTVVYPPEQTYAGPTAGAFAGCFVDLGRTPGGTVLSSPANAKSGVTATYDTWSTFYETNGIDDDGGGIIDDGTNGIDDGTDAMKNSLPPDDVPDDPGEDEVPPPYATPLRAIEIRIRCVDPTSREIRQLTVRRAFAN